jgi:hypothetical protein
VQISRQKLSRDFHKRLQVIQAKALEAAHNLPVDLKPQADRDRSSLDYSTAVILRDTLAGTAERTIFGGLTGAAGLWDKIVRAYEKESKLRCLLPLPRFVQWAFHVMVNRSVLILPCGSLQTFSWESAH